MAKCSLRTSDQVFTFAIGGNLLSRARAKIDITPPVRAYLSDLLKVDPQQLDVSIADGEHLKRISVETWREGNYCKYEISPKASGIRNHPLAFLLRVCSYRHALILCPKQRG